MNPPIRRSLIIYGLPSLRVPWLVESLEDPAAGVFRWWAANALGEIGTRKCEVIVRAWDLADNNAEERTRVRVSNK